MASSSADVLKEYLISINWQSNEAEQKKFLGSIAEVATTSQLAAKAIWELGEKIFDNLKKNNEGILELGDRVSKFKIDPDEFIALQRVMEKYHIDSKTFNSDFDAFARNFQNNTDVVTAAAKILGVKLGKDTVQNYKDVLTAVAKLPDTSEGRALRLYYENSFKLSDEEVARVAGDNAEKLSKALLFKNRHINIKAVNEFDEELKNLKNMMADHSSATSSNIDAILLGPLKALNTWLDANSDRLAVEMKKITDSLLPVVDSIKTMLADITGNVSGETIFGSISKEIELDEKNLKEFIFSIAAGTRILADIGHGKSPSAKTWSALTSGTPLDPEDDATKVESGPSGWSLHNLYKNLFGNGGYGRYDNVSPPTKKKALSAEQDQSEEQVSSDGKTIMINGAPVSSGNPLPVAEQAPAGGGIWNTLMRLFGGGGGMGPGSNKDSETYGGASNILRRRSTGKNGGFGDSASASASQDKIEGYRKIYNAAKAAGDPYPALTASQWALESQWGTKPSGKNNYFGQTTDGVPGHWVDYDSPEAGLADHIKRWSPKYAGAKSLDEATGIVSQTYAGKGGGEVYSSRLRGVMSMVGPNGVPPPPPTQTGNTAADEMERFKGMRASDPDSRAKLQAYMTEVGIPINPINEAWCADFVNSSLRHQGVPGTGSAMADSFQSYGRAETADMAQRGDIMGVPGRHVGIFTGRRDAQGRMEMISGNAGEPNDPPIRSWRSQNGGVEKRFYDPGGLYFRRPPDAHLGGNQTVHHDNSVGPVSQHINMEIHGGSQDMPHMVKQALADSHRDLARYARAMNG